MIEFISSAASRSSRDRGRQQVCLQLEGLEDRCTPATFWVNTTGDTPDVAPGDGKAQDAAGDTSLRAAIMEANARKGHDVIQFFVEVLATISLQSPLDVIIDPVTIEGTGSDLTVTRGAAAKFRIFEVGPGVTKCYIWNLTITNGHVEGIGVKGGGVLNNGHLELVGCKIYGNKAPSGGGVASIGERLDMSDCDVYQNTAENEHGGGVYVETGILNENASEIHNNTAARSGGGVYLTNATADFYEPYIYANTAQSANGGGLYLTDTQGAMREGGGLGEHRASR